MRVACLITSFTPNFDFSEPDVRAWMGPFVVRTCEIGAEGIVQVDAGTEVCQRHQKTRKLENTNINLSLCLFKVYVHMSCMCVTELLPS